MPGNNLVIAQRNYCFFTLFLCIHFGEFVNISCFGVKGAESALCIEFIKFDELLIEFSIGILFPSKNILCFELFSKFWRFPFFKKLDQPRKGGHIFVKESKRSSWELNTIEHPLRHFGVLVLEVDPHKTRDNLCIGDVNKVEAEIEWTW